MVGLWHLMGKTQWEYLLEGRTDASSKRGNVFITDNGISGNFGLVILPDECVLPEGCTFSGTGTNTYTMAQWELMEKCGAVFLASGVGHRRNVNGTLTGYSSPSYYWMLGSWIGVPALKLVKNETYEIVTLSPSDRYGCRVRLVLYE
mgnify:FL=1